MPPADAAAPTAAAATPAPETSRLQAVLDAQPDDIKARYKYRHPRETLEFFGIEPGMTIVEALPEAMAGAADAVLMVRVLHNLARFEADGGYVTEALADSYAILKPGGTLGIVQHHARDEMSDTFADGSHGYLKQGFVIAAAEEAGFEFIAASPTG